MVVILTPIVLMVVGIPGYIYIQMGRFTVCEWNNFYSQLTISALAPPISTLRMKYSDVVRKHL